MPRLDDAVIAPLAKKAQVGVFLPLVMPKACLRHRGRGRACATARCEATAAGDAIVIFKNNADQKRIHDLRPSTTADNGRLSL